MNKQDLIEQLNKATVAYDKGHPIMSDREWDDLYFELQELEQADNDVLDNSPTSNIVFTQVSKLNKVKHNHKMLSLDKTKDIQEIKNFFVPEQPIIAMCKMDGLTCSLKYDKGKLISAETRGDGEVGEDVTHNAMVISNIPKEIKITTPLVIDGEVISSYNDFSSFESLGYCNPRNFASGSIRLLDSKECANRKLQFVAWDVIQGLDNIDKLSTRFCILKELGFTVVPHFSITDKADQDFLENDVKDYLTEQATNNGYPIDGLVFKYNYIPFGLKQGSTAHHFKNAIAYKFYDETYPTELENIEWTMGRTGVLTPVAVFRPVEIDGTTISKASLHNISVMEELLGTPYSCQKIEVYKSNMIIPQIYSAEKKKDPIYEISPEYFGFFPVIYECPICGHPTEICNNNGVKVLKCTNDLCEGKFVNQIDHFVGKKGLDIKGLSTQTLSKLIEWGWLNKPADIFTLKNHASEWKSKTGFGEKSVNKILTAIEAAKECTLDSFIASIGIPLIGSTVSKELVKHIETYEDFRQKADEKFDFSVYEGFADSKCAAIWNFDFSKADEVYEYLTIEKPKEEKTENDFTGLVFVISGSLTHYKNRAELTEVILSHGGKVASSVTKNTTALITNNKDSGTSKVTTAKKLGAKVLTEQEFIENYLDK